MEIYRGSIGQLIPMRWQYWWYEKLFIYYYLLSNITMDTTIAIIIDKAENMKEWDDGIK